MSVNRAQAEEEKPSMNNDTQFLNLRVKGQDDAEMFFRVKQTTKLHKLIDAFCKHRSLDSKTVAFLFDGRRIKEHQTPQELGMEDGDEIDAMLHQTGGSHIAYI